MPTPFGFAPGDTRVKVGHPSLMLMGAWWCSQDPVRGERKCNEEQRERGHDTLPRVKECADEENVNRERMEDGSQRRPRDEECRSGLLLL